jgi:hypothetical protein
MGLLDDAIREHLDLKRRRGADPAEVERLEQEALGPVRRAPQDAEAELFEDDEMASGRYASEADLPDSAAEGDESGLFYADEEDFDPEFADPAEYEPPTEVAARPTLEPETDPGLRDSARHHEIADEWESQRRESLPDEGLEAEGERSATPRPTPATPPSDAQQISSAHREELVEQETAEYAVEDKPEPDQQGEDMLEETPEFLQDTPDHDRLWFEQRPPRDFDLDG